MICFAELSGKPGKGMRLFRYYLNFGQKETAGNYLLAKVCCLLAKMCYLSEDLLIS